MKSLKYFEIRDEGTCIPVIALKLAATNEAERYLISRAGYGADVLTQMSYVLLARLAGGEGPLTCDPVKHGLGGRTMKEAHRYIKKNWDELESGTVVDVEYILGETKEPKAPEMVEMLMEGT